MSMFGILRKPHPASMKEYKKDLEKDRRHVVARNSSGNTSLKRGKYTTYKDHQKIHERLSRTAKKRRRKQ